MPLTAAFMAEAERLFDAGMGTENSGYLLYAIARMSRPVHVLEIGLGYSTLFLLEALRDNQIEAERDAAIMRGERTDVARAGVLHPSLVTSGRAGVLHGVDDFSEGGSERRERLLACIDRLQLTSHFELHETTYQRYQPAIEYDLLWIDCGHQLEYTTIINKFWPRLNPFGGVCALHYTHVARDVAHGCESDRVLFAGAVLNAIRRQQLSAGLQSGFETLSLVEEHKWRQGSITLLRRLDATERCRDHSLNDEMKALYGTCAEDLIDLNAESATESVVDGAVS